MDSLKSHSPLPVLDVPDSLDTHIPDLSTLTKKNSPVLDPIFAAAALPLYDDDEDDKALTREKPKPRRRSSFGARVMAMFMPDKKKEEEERAQAKAKAKVRFHEYSRCNKFFMAIVVVRSSLTGYPPLLHRSSQFQARLKEAAENEGPRSFSFKKGSPARGLSLKDGAMDFGLDTPVEVLAALASLHVEGNTPKNGEDEEDAKANRRRRRNGRRRRSI